MNTLLHPLQRWLFGWAMVLGTASAATQDGNLKMEVITAYNFVVDSNVESPSSYSPSAAHLGVKVVNTGATTLTNVAVNIGDLTDPLNGPGTPGTFPSRTVTVTGAKGYSGTFALQMPGGAADAVRVIPSIAPGESVVQYFFVTYPLKDPAGNSVAGAAADPSDDLWLNYDVWASATEGAATRRVDKTNKVTMRNEISAMANKIWPNTTSKVPSQYLDAIQQNLGWRPDSENPQAGSTARMEGIWYDFGNVGAGFDNDGDGLPDRNAWMQPVGDPSLYDPLSSRLVKCYGIVIIKLNDGTEKLIPFEDRLYFENIPANNTGAVGFVFYEFIPLSAGGSSTLSPYQEVASGYDNEKFNGDYGASSVGITSAPPQVAFDKTGPAQVAGGGVASYALTATNNGSSALGLPGLSLPFVFEDSIPAGLVYGVGSATASNTIPAGNTVVVSWSTDNGLTWVTTEPAAASVTHVRWTLASPLATGTTATVRFQASVPTTYPSVTIDNTGIIKLGPTGSLATSTVTTLVTGINSIGDLVWKDDNRDSIKDAGETGISNITVRLYNDANASGTLDAADLLYGTTTTNGSGIYGFANLPDGRFIVVVDDSDNDLPAGHILSASTNNGFAVNLDAARVSSTAVNFLTADWPFISALTVSKTATPTIYGAGSLVNYTIDLENLASPVAPKTIPVRTAWATTVTGTRTVQNGANAQGEPDSNHARVDFAQNSDTLTTSGGFTYASPTGTITKVELVFNGYLDQALVNDQMEVIVNGSTFSTLTTTQLNSLQGAGVTFAVDVSSINPTWSWAQVQALTGALKAAKVQSADAGTVWVDALGFRVTTAPVAPPIGTYGPTTLDPLPLVDTFDAARLEYVSSSLPPTSVSGGTITWNNAGPVNPGGRKTITVTFRAKTTATAVSTTNTATSTGGVFVSGRPANSATSSVAVTINPRGQIGDFVFWDLNNNGAFDSGEPGLPNVLVSLDNGAQVRTDSNGYYIFRNLPDGNFTVTVNTATLPWTSFTQTFDPDGAVKDNASTVTINNTNVSTADDGYLDRDFGYRSVTNVISGFIFQDINGNSIKDAGETFLTGVTVTLSGTSGGTTTTDSSGFYQFGSLANGTYAVTVTQPGGTTQTLDPDATVNNATTVVASGGNLYPNRNFAYKPTGSLSIGDTLYHDWNGNGIQDAGDGGIANVDVFLYRDTNGDGEIDTLADPQVAATSTNASGVYGFGSLPAGTYIVVVNTLDPQFPANVVQTQDYDGVRDSKAVVNLTASLLTVDFGYRRQGTGSIGDTVFVDANGDGLKGAVEAGIANVPVTLYADLNGNGIIDPAFDGIVATATTGSTGGYLFTGLAAGSYLVDVSQSAAAVPNDAFGNKYRLTTVDPHPVTLASGQAYLAADFGFAAPAAIGDFVYFDANGNGTQDFSETGIPNVTVQLFLDVNQDGQPDSPTPVATTVTADGSGANPAGFYQFSNLAAGTYFVKVLTSTLPQSGGLPIPLTADPDRDGVPVGDNTYPGLPAGDDADSLVIVSLGGNYTGADFGYRPPGSIGDFVWLDLNQDGVQDQGEPGIANVSVEVSNGVTTTTTTTDFDGRWSLANIADGAWTVGIPASNFAPGGALENTINTYDAEGAVNSSAAFVLTNGSINLPVGNLGLDFGYKLAGIHSLSGTVITHDTMVIGTADDIDDFYDDGVDQDAGPNDEIELEGIEVYLYTSAGRLLGSTFTDSNGNYHFAGLPSGDYRVIIGTTSVVLQNSTLTTTAANNLAVTSVNSSSGTSVIQSVTIGNQDVTDVDFAFISDVDYDYGDLPLGYAATTLGQDGARHIIPASGTTIYLGTAPDVDTNGIPSPLAVGDDSIGSDDEDGVTAINPASWTDGASGGTVSIDVTGNGWLVGWIDWNHDGDFLDIGEMIVSQAVTTGTSMLAIDIPAGTLGSGSQSWLSRFRLFTSAPAYPLFSYTGVAIDGEVEDHLIEKPVGSSIGDIVWNDANGNGLLDSGESGLGGLTVEIRDGGNNLIGTQVSGNGSVDVDGDGVIDPAGYYRFRALAAGNFTITVTTPPAGFNPSYDENGTATPHLTTVALGSGEQHLSADFGYAPMLASISGQVRYDVDSDGDLGDPDNGAMVVTIQLWTDPDGDGNPADGVQVGEVRTDVDGNYSFANIPTGKYVVVEINPSGSTSTADIDGGNFDRIAVNLVGANITGRDFLDTLPPVYAISGTVYNDDDATNDNVIGAGDVPLAGVTVSLHLDRDGNGVVSAGDSLLQSTTTGNSGTYQFSGLPAGNYVVVETDPSGATSDWDAYGSLTDNQIGVVLVDADVTGRDFLDDGYLGSLSGTVFTDTDNDGDGDQPLENVLLRLLNASGNPVLDGLGAPVTTLTLADGSYHFGNLPPGDYGVSQDQPSGYASVGDSDGPNDNLIGNVTAITVTAGNNSGGNDFIEIQLGVISGYVRKDSDNNGSGDAALAGVTLNLLDGSGNPVTGGLGGPIVATTTAGGFYSFTDVPVGSYRVSQDQPAGYASVSDVDGANNNVIGDETPIVMTPGLVVTGRDFVEIELGSISGTVTKDTDANGSGDAPFVGVLLTLLDGAGDPVLSGGLPVTATTDVTGAYSFTNLHPGDYQVAETQPSGYGSVSDVDGGNLDLIGNVVTLSVAPGEDVTGRDFVEIELGAISGYVSANGNPLAFITLTLLDDSGAIIDGDPVTPGVQPISVTTDSNGFYIFTGVIPGSYQVAQTQPFGYNSESDRDGGDLNIVGDVTRIVVSPGQTNADNNFVETVITCASTWAEWKFINPSESAGGNPDADAYDNFAEFAFAMPYDSGVGSPWLGSTAWIIQPSTLIPGTLEGVFVRPKGAVQNVTYTLEYAAALGSPTVWQSVAITPAEISTVDNGDCTETVTIHGLETLTGLIDGSGFVRIKADLDEAPPSGTDHTSFTEVEGWKDTGLEICCRTYSNPFLREAAFTGTITGVTGQTLDLTVSGGGSDLGTFISAGGFYLEVTSGDNEGQRFDVVSGSVDSLTLATDSNLFESAAPHNTWTGALPANLAGDSVVLRRHWTLGELFPAAGFGATDDPTTADQIQVFAGGVWSFYWLYDDGVNPPQWVKSGDNTYADQGGQVIPPGQGVFFNNRTSVTSILAYGEVRPNDFVRPLAVGSNLVSGGYPLDQSAASARGRDMTVAQGFFGSRDLATADTFYVWRGDSAIGANGYDSWFLNDNAPRLPHVVKWVKIGDASLLSRDAEVLLLGDRCVFIRSRNGSTSYTDASPWSP